MAKEVRFETRPEDCPYCLRWQLHSIEEHFQALERNDDASKPDEEEPIPKDKVREIINQQAKSGWTIINELRELL